MYQEILNRAPFSEAYTDRILELEDPPLWRETVEKYRGPLWRSLIARIGEDGLRVAMTPLILNIQLQNILSPQILYGERAVRVEDLLLMGFEIGNVQDIDCLKPNILTVLANRGVISMGLMIKMLDRKGEVAGSPIMSVLYSGAIYSHFNPTLEVGNSEGSSLEVFRTFVNSDEFRLNY